MSLSSRLAARGLSPDYQPLRGAARLLDAGIDDAHLLAEHRAACDEIKRLRAENQQLRLALDTITSFVGYDGRYVVLCDDGSVVSDDEMMDGDLILVDRGDDSDEATG